MDHAITSSSSLSDPKLPPELERIVFEFTALLHPTAIPRLMLIAWRVKYWVEPLFYRVVVVSFFRAQLRPKVVGLPTWTADVFLEQIEKRKPSFFHVVRHLFLGYAPTTVPISTVDTILGACPRVTNLFAHGQSASVTSLSGLKFLRHLTITADVLFQPVIPFSAPLFFNLTHLELLDGAFLTIDIHTIWEHISGIPHLTHIAFNSTSITDLTPTLTRENTQIKCIVYLFGIDEDDDDDFDMEHFRPLAEDTRFVCIQQSDWRLDWLRGAAATMGDDYWTLAEVFIAAKVAGKIDRSRFFIVDTDQSWRR
ncbi:hypothetical protein MVEN_00468800 [Mycena venus]|uniref:Uncharacterized protein n=1 Tax=Mycena venus TaxID=2733690 RepID=A0A8H7D953_9AGAR|nr:hypothetical protein MVEN_00468800 [Mycena venus]